MATLKTRYHTPDAKGKRAVKGHYITFRDPNRRPAAVEVPTGTKDVRAAQSRLREAEQAYADRRYDPWNDPPPWKAKTGAGLTVVKAVERFLASRTDASTGRNCTPKTVRAYRVHLSPLLSTLPPGLALVDLTRDHVERYRRTAEAAGVRPVTLDTYARALRVFAQWCRTAESDGGGGLAPVDWKPDAPARVTRPIHDDAPKYFTGEEIALLVESARSTARARPPRGHRDDGSGASWGVVTALLPDIIAFTAGTGLRLGEVCALLWSDVTRDDTGRAFVRVISGERHRTKTGKSRTVPLVGDALAAIERRRAADGVCEGSTPVFPAASGGSLHGPYLSKLFSALVKQTFPPPVGAERDRRCFHSLRHTFGTAAVGLGLDLYQVQTVLGHGSSAMSQRYAKLLPAGLHDGLNRAFGSSAKV